MTTTKSKHKITKAVPEAILDTDPMASLKIKLQSCDLEVQNYATALEAENLKCAKKVAQLQAVNVALNNRIKSIVEQNEKDKGATLAAIMSNLNKRSKTVQPPEALYSEEEEAKLIADAEHEVSKRDVSRF
jgi:hypothetical protein